MSVYYNEIDHFCCEVIRKNIKEGNIPDGRVDERDIRTVRPDDLAGFRQVHLFAGIGGAAYAARLAGAERVNLWTFGFPCQDISCAGKGEGIEGERSGLFFQVARLLRDSPRRPDWLLAENVPALRKRGADRVLDELEGLGYACRPVVVGAECAGAPHKRQRVWIVGHSPGLFGDVRHDFARSGLGEPFSELGNVGGAGRMAGLADPIRLDGGGGGEVSFGEAAERTALEGSGRGELADAEGGERDSGHQAEGVDAERYARLDVGGGGGTQLADTRQSRLAGRRELPIGTGSQVSLPASGGGSLWPSRPGEPQYDWEAPRLIELPLGGSVDGIPVKLVRSNNRNALKAYGNSWVPQCGALVLRWIAWADEQLKEAR